MGNLSSCCSCNSGENCCWNRSESTGSKKMVPADLHSSGAQGNFKNQSFIKGQKQSGSPEAQRGGANSPDIALIKSKFSEFSLHGVQKTSPVGNSDESLVAQERVVHHKFLVKNISSFFDKYKDSETDDILAEGIDKLCTDLNVDPAEFIVLAIAWKFKATAMCRFTRKEFTDGCISLQADSIKSLTDSFPSLEKEAMANFKDIYKFAFQFGLDADQGQRSLPCDVAIGMWQVVFSKNIPALLEEWIKFLQDNQVRGISRDTWNMFLNFTENVGSDLSSYDDSEAWPSLFDDFVEYYREQKEKAKDNPEEKQPDDESPVLDQNSKQLAVERGLAENEVEAKISKDQENAGSEIKKVAEDATNSNEIEKSSGDTAPSNGNMEKFEDTELITSETLHSSHTT